MDATTDYSPLSKDDISALHASQHIDNQPADLKLTLPSLVRKRLTSLHSTQAPGPDGIQNWVLKEYAKILATPISDILNSSLTH